MIVDPGQLALFIPAALALNLTPGADMTFCLGQGLKSGPSSGLAASLGIATGGLIHTVLAALGLAALLAAHPVSFEVLRWAGVAYLVWLAVKAVRVPVALNVEAAAARANPVRAWAQGTVVNLFNPKVIVFMLAFLPQFVDPARGSTLLQFLVLGLVFNLGSAAVNAMVGMGAGALRTWSAARPGAGQVAARLTAVLFLGLAARLALSR